MTYFKQLETQNKKSSENLAAITENCRLLDELTTRQMAQEELAFDLINSEHLAEQLIQAFQINAEKVQSLALKHQGRLTVADYQTTQQPSEQQRLASILLQDYRSHYRLIKQHQLNLMTLCHQAWQHQNISVDHQLSAEEKIAWQTLGNYFNQVCQTRQQWEIIKSKKDDNNKVSPLFYQTFSEHRQKRNQLAFELDESWSTIKALISRHLSPDIDIESRIAVHRQQQQDADKVKQFIDESDSISKSGIADEILDDYPRYATYLHDNKLHLTLLRQSRWEHSKRMIQHPLPQEAQTLIQSIDGYLSHANHAQQQWAAIYDDKRHQQHIDSSRIQAAYTSSDQRNYCAWLIQQQTDKQATIVNCLDAKAKILIEKHAARHAMRLEDKVLHEHVLDTRDWQLLLDYDKEMANLGHQTRYSTDSSSYATGMIQKPYYDKHLILQAAWQQHGKIISQLLNTPKNTRLSRDDLAVWGSKGSVKFHISGDKAGVINDFERGIHGDLIHYYAQLTNQPWKIALSAIASLTGMNANCSDTKSSKPIPLPMLTSKTKAENKKALARIERKRRLAQRIWREAIPIHNTPAARYLKQHRHIQHGLDKLIVKYHPKTTDYLIDQKGQFKARYIDLQLLVQQKTHKVRLFPFKLSTLTLRHTIKQVTGCAKTYLWQQSRLAAAIYTGGGKEVILAEGVETAASLIVAKPKANIYVSFGHVTSMGKYGYLAEKHQTDTILIAADNDDADPKSHTWASVEKAATQLAKNGIKVNIAKPEALTSKDCFYQTSLKTDFNDLLQHRGVEAVIKNIKPMYTVSDSTSNIKTIKLSKSSIKPVNQAIQKIAKTQMNNGNSVAKYLENTKNNPELKQKTLLKMDELNL